MRHLWSVCFLVSVLVSSGCGSDPNAPTAENFRVAINAALAAGKNPYCIDLVRKTGPYGVQKEPLVDELVKAGLLEEIRSNPPYTLTKKGEAVISGRSLWGKFGWLPTGCVADGAEVDEIVNWDLNAPGAATLKTRVKYTYKPTKIAEWVTPEMAKHLPILEKREEETITLKLTAKGWEAVKRAW